MADAILQQQPVSVTAETDLYLTKEGLGMRECMLDADKMAYRRAISAVAAVDRSGAILSKWAMEGDSALTKLHRFAEKINAIVAPLQQQPTN